MSETYFVFALVGLAVVLFSSSRVRLDFVALLIVLLLAVSGILTADEAFAGFGNPVVLLVAGLFVIGEALDRTGVAQSIGVWITDVGGASHTRLTVLIMMVAAALSSVMSSTAVVAIFIPIIFKVSKQTGINTSRLLLPMSFAAMISGMLTLIATMPNMVVSETLVSSGFEPLGFFSFSPIGIAVLLVAIVYFLTIGNRLLHGSGQSTTPPANRTITELWQEFTIAGFVNSVYVPDDSPLRGQTIGDAAIESRYGIHVLGMSLALGHGERGETLEAGPTDEISAGCYLLLTGEPPQVEEFVTANGLVVLPIPEREKRRQLQESGAGVIMIHPHSQFRGKSIRQANLRTLHGIHVIGMRRGQERVDQFQDVALREADMLLVAGRWQRIAQLGKAKHDFVLLELPAEYAEARPGFRLAPIAIAVLAMMVVLSLSGLVPISVAVMIAAMTAVITRCLTAEDAYHAISWSSLVLLAGMLPLAAALEKTGGTQLLVDSVLGAVGSGEPYLMMTILFFLTACLSLFLSNTATAVLLAPVAVRMAQSLDVSPYPLAITVLIAASSAFASPVASPVVTLVVEPGRYRFVDFVKVGGPLMFIAYLTNLLLTPWLFPF